uniref:Interleukin-1 beta n=2 Tax=Electrophorus electricus TaxID=8005 RepID=A0A4W4EGS2_ELEEL
MVQMIDNVDTQDLPPEEFAQMLTSGSSMLTLHGACTDKEQQESLESNTLQTYFKENTTLSFSLVMVREESLEQEEETSQEVEEELESSDLEDDCFPENKVLMVSLTNMSVSVLTGRGYDSDIACSMNKVVVTAKQCEVQSVCKKYIMQCRANGRFLIQSLTHTPITSGTVKRTFCRSYSTSDITIYYYKSNIMEDLQPRYKGSPVVLNFTDTNNFLKCTKDETDPDKPAILTLECCDKKDLKKIFKDDTVTWPFVFYMTCANAESRRFESAAYNGWFIHTVDINTVDMVKRPSEPPTEDSFLFFIHPKWS